MSDSAECDHCGKSGRRARGTLAPEGWLYAEVTNVGDADADKIVVWACSKECAAACWKGGPAFSIFAEEIDPMVPMIETLRALDPEAAKRVQREIKEQIARRVAAFKAAIERGEFPEDL